MPRWYPTTEHFLLFNGMQIELLGGEPTIRDEKLIDSAINRLQTGYYEDIVEEASALWESLLKNHALVDGNKRAALHQTLTFLYVNDYDLEAEENDIISFINGLFETNDVNSKYLDSWLREHVVIS